MDIEDMFSYRNLEQSWLSDLIDSIRQIPDTIFFEKDGAPLKREVSQLDSELYKRLIAKYGRNVESNFTTMTPANQFSIDIVLPTIPQTLIEIEKGKLPRLELDIMKIVNTILRFPETYGYGCMIVPVNYIRLNLAGRRYPYQYLKNNLLPLNDSLFQLRTSSGSQFYIKDFVVIGYRDPRG